MQPDIIFMMGRSGVGKGTQSQLLADEFAYFHWENGAILRSMGNFKLKNGQILSEYIGAGNFVSDSEIMEMFYERLRQIPDGKKIIFDGIPRSQPQAEEMVAHFQSLGKSMATIYLDVHDEELVRRLLERAKTEGRADDHLEAIKQRLAQFEKLTAPAIDYLKTQTKFFDVDGRPPIPDVHQTILKALNFTDHVPASA